MLTRKAKTGVHVTIINLGNITPGDEFVNRPISTMRKISKSF